MTTFESTIEYVGTIEFPAFSETRILMMPFHLHDVEGTLHLAQWVKPIEHLVSLAPCQEGVAYLTIDEGVVPAGQTQRRPGLHVDGMGPAPGLRGLWGSGPGGWGPPGYGMLLTASVLGSEAFRGTFHGELKVDGDCAHLEGQLSDKERIPLTAGAIWHLDGLTVHRSIPQERTAPRQFVRLSMPSTAPWHINCTNSPFGILPEGPLATARPIAFQEGRNL